MTVAQSEPACEELRCFGVGGTYVRSGPRRAGPFATGSSATRGYRTKDGPVQPCLPWRVLNCGPLSMGEKYDDMSTSFMVNTIGIYLVEGVEASLTEIRRSSSRRQYFRAGFIYDLGHDDDIKRSQVSPGPDFQSHMRADCSCLWNCQRPYSTCTVVQTA